ncbi:hypothetical protein ATHL_01572 [Anaerolinea thermolimosa]|uniref:hypothetical protein n=1 Tax=Anaerolinea thermolimosa TaxID=229919 RepID=UPI0007833398|nr:hypothetical protein [Anaerolinea thermolimosa]GAP06715.1 hypothetical protein ATHL_01572 [Anaerolinea thermolimosa]
MKKYIERVQPYIKFRNLIIIFMVIIPFNILIFPILSENFRSVSGNLQTLDVQFGYSPEDALNFIQRLGETARHFYLLIEWTADLFYPIIYSSLFTLLLGLLFKAVHLQDKLTGLRYLIVLPVFMMGFDYSENILLSILLLWHNSLSGYGMALWVASFASIASLCKWLTGGLILITLFTGFILFTINIIRTNSLSRSEE